jgi:hypothetical protein
MTSARVEEKKCLGPILEFPPNLLYAKVRSWDSSPSRSRGVQLGLLLQILAVHAKLQLHGLHYLCTLVGFHHPFDGLASGPKTM